MNEEKWRDIEPFGSPKTPYLERWADGSWANVLPPDLYYGVKRINRLAIIIFIVGWIVVGFLG